MQRKILAVLAFNGYAFILIEAFMKNTPYLFDAHLIADVDLSGIEVDPREWGWGDHYIWRLVAAVVVTALVGFLAGAISRDKGGKVAALSNIPSVIIWGVMVYILIFSELQIESRMGFLVIAIVAIPLTTYIAYITGNLGKDIQQQEFSEHTVLGIKGYHWIWAIVPIYFYSLGIIFVVTKFVGFQLATWRDMSIFPFLVSLVLLIPIVAWLYPLRLVHRILMGNLISNYNTAMRSIAVFGILIIGVVVAAAIQFGVYWLLSGLLT